MHSSFSVKQEKSPHSVLQGCKTDATPLIVLVTDTCDTCATKQLNIHASAFEDHFQNDLSVGQVMVQWQQV